MELEICSKGHLHRGLNKCEEKIKSKDKIVDFDTHLKILNFLIHLKGIGAINSSQYSYYSSHIQDYLKKKKDDLDFLESFLNEILNLK